jgi:hypothetical protein
MQVNATMPVNKLLCRVAAHRPGKTVVAGDAEIENADLSGSCEHERFLYNSIFYMPICSVS